MWLSMAALAYLLLPLSGLIAFATGGEARVRFHGLQAIVFGTVFAAALALSSALGRSSALVVALLGAIGWAVLAIGTAAGRDPRLPLISRTLWEVARRER